jgi:arsenate reductase
MATVLFVSEFDSGDSPMAAALLERAAAGRHTALSAGTGPGDRVDPRVVDVMRAVGIELGDRRPRLVTDDLVEQANVVVTIGDVEECPYVPGRL